MEKINEEKNAVTDIAEQQNAIGALIESERSKSTLISNLPGVAYRSESDEELTMVFISDGCYELTGYTSEELLMKEPSYYDLILPDYRDALFEKWKYDFGLNVITPDEYPIRTASGEIKWVWEQYQEVYDANQNKLATEGLIIDITERRRVEKKLKESEERFKIIFEEAPLGVGIFDSTTGMAYQVNKKFAEIIGRTRAEALSLNWSEYTYPADIQENLEKLNLMNQGLLTGFSLEKRFLKKDGTIIWVNITITPFQYGNNSDPSHLCMVEDISERKEYETNLLLKEQEYLNIIDGSSEGSFICDFQKSEFFISEKWKKRLGIENLSPQEIVFAPELLSHPDDVDRISKIYKEAYVKQAPKVRMEFRAKTIDSGYIWILGQAKIIYDESGKPVKYYGTHIDITDKKNMETALREGEKLSKNMIEELQRINTQKNTFISVLSHELRNPLAIIMNSILLLKQSVNDSEKIKKMINTLERQAHQLCKIVDDLLDVSRVIQNTITLNKQMIDCIELIKALINDHSEQVRTKEISLKYHIIDTPVFIYADSDRLTQVFENILGNAIKYTKSGGSVDIKVSKDDNKNELVITVIDTGIGIDSKFMPFLFEPFAQANKSLDRQQAGLGLGLTIVKEIVDLHNGSINVFSDGIGKGSTFTIRLPIQDIELNVNEKPHFQEIKNRPLKILIIEDNEDLMEITCELLTFLGHEIISASDGYEGIKKGREHRPEVLLCDIGLPNIDGYQIAQIFKNDEELKNIYRIALSGYIQKEDLERSKLAGFQRHLAKPIRIEMLKEALAEIR